MAANAVKILPGIAEQLNDIKRTSNKAYPVRQVIITEDEISTDEVSTLPLKERATFREVTSSDIAKEITFNDDYSTIVDFSDAIKIRQKRLVEHQEIVRMLAYHNENYGFKLFEGKFDCLGVRGKNALLYEVKTILANTSDQEKQTIKGVGQLKYYKFSIVEKKMGFSDIWEILVFSGKPSDELINFCTAEKIIVIWRVHDLFQIYNVRTNESEYFEPIKLSDEHY